jgi:signal transduction histidine kinase
VLVFAVSQVLIDPLSSISDVVQKMSDGHLDRRIDIRGYDEYAKLAHAFNEMAEKLEMVDKTRQEFVSNVSHELKTPLSSIKVLSESILLQKDVPVEMHREFLQDINSEIDRMATVINDLLQLVKLDEGELGLKVMPININSMVTDILKRLSPLAEQKNIKLLIEEPREVVADVDEVKLSSAISNLVDNAIKYTCEEGEVKITVDADHQNVFISIVDNGIGINEADQGKIFERFYRVDKTRDRETGGTGLGLSITMATLRLHNGSIRVTSKENEGSTFIVRIPIHYSGKG